MSSYRTQQEEFWAGAFGDEYQERNRAEVIVNRKIAFWARVLRATSGVGSIKEFGCNIGINLAALSRLLPDCRLGAVEINASAAEVARKLGVADVETGTIIEPMDDVGAFDLTFTSGVLIHVAPDALPRVYDNLYAVSRRYVMVCEYYNPTPVTVPYRGNDDRLFKRDFAGDLIDRFGMKLIDYGFVYRRDNVCPADDVTWFLLEK